MDRFTQVRKQCSKDQTALRTLLTKPIDFQAVIKAVLNQHACLHNSQLTGLNPQDSLEDLVLNDLDEVLYRRIPANQDHSIAWAIWHLARIEDCALNTLVAGESTVFEKEGWKDKLKTPYTDTGNAMPCEQIREMSEAINLQAIREYRMAVGKQTRTIISNLSETDLEKKVQPLRLQVLIASGCVRREAKGLIDYWSKRTIAGLLLMPATRHNIVHLNEAYDLKQRKK